MKTSTLIDNIWFLQQVAHYFAPQRYRTSSYLHIARFPALYPSSRLEYDIIILLCAQYIHWLVIGFLIRLLPLLLQFLVGGGLVSLLLI